MAASCEPGISISKLALEKSINANLLIKWRQQWARESCYYLPQKSSSTFCDSRCHCRTASSARRDFWSPQYQLRGNVPARNASPQWLNQRKVPDSANTGTEMMIPLCLATGAKWSEAENLRGSQISAGKVTFIKTKHKCNRTIPLDVDLIFELSKKSALLRFQEYSWTCWMRSACWSDNPYSMVYVCEPLHDERRQYTFTSKDTWIYRHKNDNVLRALCT